MSASKPAESFAELAVQLEYSMLVVTTAADGERAGCLIGFATQVSIDPPRFLACLSVKNRTYRVTERARVLVVHFVPAERSDLAELFGGKTGDELDKFERCDWRPGPDGAPIVTDLENWFAGRIMERIDFGDHVGFLLEPIEGQVGRGTASMTFHRAKGIDPGHAP
jgi:flavin reductase (DIM6/NTAB) family NADH-FMN oxidoreductase RutF